MDFYTCFREQLRLHPSMQPQDVLKLCFQATWGAEHLLADIPRAREYFDREYAATPADANQPLFEPISEHVARVNIAAWKAARLPAEWLFRMFVHTASLPFDDEELLNQYVAEATEIIEKEQPFSMAAWESALDSWRADWWPSVHHSDKYRAAERPAYRIVRRRFQCILPILQHLRKIYGARVIAIDGRAASGKTTKAELLSVVLDAPVIHMDDFFLPPALRTEERLAQPGGNVDYERFAREVVPHLRTGKAFQYRIFDCGQMDFAGTRDVPAAPVRIVEGSYSHHPELGKYADLRIFTSIDPQEQMERILRRNGEKLAEMFRTRWIPMEEKYFAAFAIREKSELIL